MGGSPYLGGNMDENELHPEDYRRKEFADSLLVKRTMLEDGYSLDEVCAAIIREAMVATGRDRLWHRPVFIWRKDESGDERLGWYSGPPNKLRERMEKEGWKRVDEAALGAGTIVPVLRG